MSSDTGLDPRGLRFAAVITSIVLALALLLNAPWIAALQWLVFAIGTIAGPRLQPYAVLFRAVVAPRLGPPSEREDPRPPRFAQAVGLGFVTVAVVAKWAGASVLFQVAVGAALLAAALNAVFNVCLGCEVYLRVRRIGSTAT